MAKHKLKQREYDASQFKEILPPAKWPVGVRVNALSATGYSYGTLETNQYGRDGFEVLDGDYIFYNPDGTAYRVSEESYNLHYVPA